MNINVRFEFPCFGLALIENTEKEEFFVVNEQLEKLAEISYGDEGVSLSEIDRFWDNAVWSFLERYFEGKIVHPMAKAEFLDLAKKAKEEFRKSDFHKYVSQCSFE